MATAGDPTSADRARVDRTFPLFAVLFAAAQLLDQAWWGGFEVVSLHGLVVLAACVVLARPGAVTPFALLLAVVATSVAADLPGVGTHRLVVGIVAVTLLAHLAVVTAARRGVPSPAAFVAGITPFLRATVVVVYLASALAKLNAAFLDPAVSCASPMIRGLLGPDPAMLTPAIVGTVVAEATLPVLLLVPVTRRAAVVVGTGFHAVLALAGNVPFSALMLALYVAFLPPLVTARVPAPAPARWAGRAVVLAALVAGWLAASRVGPSDDYPGLTGVPSALVDPTVAAGATGAYLLLAAALVVVAVWPRGAPTAERSVASRAGRLALAVGAAALVANAAAPYAGWKTDTSYEMFSGLRTEPGGWNHLVVPESVRVLDAQDELVEVVAASDPALVARTAGGARMVLPTLARELRARPGAVATYRTAADPALRTLGPLPADESLLQRVAVFRDVPPPGVPRC